MIDNAVTYFFLGNWLTSGSLPIYVLGLIIYAVIISIVISVYAYLFSWMERKMMAKVQHRHGPTYVGKYGILQNLADLVKLLAKEEIVPENADKPILLGSVMLVLGISTFLILLLPFDPALQATNLGFGLLVVFVLIAFFPILIFLTGFASGNKFADVSAQRSVLMLLAYEIPMLIVVGAAALLAGSYSLQALITAQSPYYYVLLMPIGFVVFFIVMLAEVERPPFDLREADSELIAGWLTDVSAPFYAIALFIDYTRMFLGSLLISIIFFGGWLGPSILPGVAWLLIKAVIISLFIIIVRVTTVRMRIDRILHTGWWYLMPLSLINLILTYIIFVR